MTVIETSSLIENNPETKADSLELSQMAARSTVEVIVFCGVRFMAETAAILCPEKTALLPDMNSGCLLANMVTVEQLQQREKGLPQATVVCFRKGFGLEQNLHLTVRYQLSVVR